jgi:hypothetical protein
VRAMYCNSPLEGVMDAAALHPGLHASISMHVEVDWVTA